MHRGLRTAFLLTMWILTGTCAAAQVDQPPQPIRVLLLSGANNHDWRTTTPRIKAIIESLNRFNVDVLEETHTLSAEMLAKYDVIVSDFNTFTARRKVPRDPGWSDAAKRAYTDFVRSGKGHVVIHAGSSSFYDWDEYQELVISSFKVGQTDHGTRHEFPVRIDVPDHAITKDMPPFVTFDELWHNAPVQHEATVLASAFSSTESRGSGRYEPIAMVREFGDGRSFTLMLGHDIKAMENFAFQALLVRGAEWAATGEVSIGLPDDFPSIPEGELPAPERTLSWNEGEDSVALLDGEEVIWRLNHGENVAKPHFHPVALPGKPALTWSSPPDHPWHHGLWFCWKYINGVNYWEENREYGRSDGLTEQTDIRLTKGKNHAAKLELDLVYRPANGEPVLIERRVIEVSPPQADGEYHLDWTMTFTALREDVVFDRTPLPDEPNGKIYGGYAGLSARLAEDLERRTIVSSDGPVNFKDNRYRGRARGMDYTGMLDGEAMGVAIIDHPDNLNAPSPWYAIRSDVMSYFSPAVVCYGSHRLPAGESMTLRYRTIVHGGRWSGDKLVSEHKRFIEESLE